MVRFLYGWLLGLLALNLVDSQPLSCKGDEHCSEGYYCDLDVHLCQQCLQCQNLNRMMLIRPDLNNTCVKSCGPCFEGFVNIFMNDVKEKCVSSDLLQYNSEIYCIYIWMTALILSFIVVLIMIIDILRNTELQDPRTIEGEMSTERNLGAAAA